MKSVGNKLSVYIPGLSGLFKAINLKFLLNRWSLIAIFIAILVIFPLGIIFLNIFSGPGESWEHIKNTVLGSYISNTIILVIGTGLLTFLIGVSTAWFVSVFDFPGRKFMEWGLILPLSIPTYIMAFSYAGILDFTGPIQSFLRNSFNVHIADRIGIMNIYGAIFVISIALFPYVYLVARASFSYQSANILEAGRVLGSSLRKTFFRLALPVSRPAIIAGLSLVIFEVLNDYGAVKYYGVPTFTTGIFRAWFSLGEAKTAVYLSALLMIFVFAAILTERIQRGNLKYEFESSPRAITRITPSFITKLLLSIICWIVFLTAFFFPFLQLLYWSIQTAPHTINSNFFYLIGNSFMLAAITSLVCVVAGLLMLYSVRLNKNIFLRFISKIASIGYAVPGAVIAVGVLIPLLELDKKIISVGESLFNVNLGLVLTGTLMSLVFAYIVRFLAVGYNPIDSGFKKIGDKVDQVSRTLGAGPLRTLLKIDLPLLKGAILSAGILVFVDVLKELPLTLILRPFNFHTLATKTFELASDELVAQSANSALIIILTGFIPVWYLSALMTKRFESGS